MHEELLRVDGVGFRRGPSPGGESLNEQQPAQSVSGRSLVPGRLSVSHERTGITRLTRRSGVCQVIHLIQGSAFWDQIYLCFLVCAIKSACCSSRPPKGKTHTNPDQGNHTISRQPGHMEMLL